MFDGAVVLDDISKPCNLLLFHCLEAYHSRRMYLAFASLCDELNHSTSNNVPVLFNFVPNGLT